MTDFGGDGRACDPVQIHMEAKDYTFTEAVLDLAAIFNVCDELNRSVNKPDIRKEPAKADQEEKLCFWDIDQEFSADECAVMGPRVTVDHLKALHWYRVKSISHVKNREVIHKYSNENYPIFMRECWFDREDGGRDCFYKVYEPLNPEKQWRFSYQPANKKPQSYINGLEELAAAWTAYNEAEERAWNSDPANEDKPYKEKKLPEAVICSGERDALCVRSLGYHPLWFNSETYKVSNDEYRRIMRYVERLYNIPDIDNTGRLKGTEMALRFIDIHTIWLPAKLSSFRDNRGKPRKDFRDWMEIYKENSDFRGLLELATPAKFWRTSKSDKSGALKYSIRLSCLYQFLMLNGFYSLKDDHAATTRFIKVTGSVVKSVTPRDIREFVHEWALDTAQPMDLRDLILSTPTLSAASLDSLKSVDLDFTNCTERSQLFYFPKFAVEVTGTEIIKHDSRLAGTGRYVWEANVIPHNIGLLPDMFTITRKGDGSSSEDFDIDIHGHCSNFFCYLINSSRIYWRKELEYGLESLPADMAAKYRADHRFDIAGPGLTPSEIAEQKRCLINKIFTIGYMLHRFKAPSRAWAPFAMDNVIGRNDQCNGRSGKSFMFMALSRFINSVKLSGRNPKLLDNPFVFEQVNRHSDMVLVDDCAEYLPIKEFYDSISSSMTINAKNIQSYSLPFNESPKFAFTSNYVPKDFDPSSRQRMLYVVFSDYYHQRTEENDYLETRQIRDDFNKDLLVDGYSEPEWEADINFMLQCVRFYLSVSRFNIKIEPRLEAIIFRKHLREMSDNFKDWAEYYFAENGGNLDREIVRADAFDNYKYQYNIRQITMQKFSKSLAAFCFTCDYIAELNPAELQNSGDRILRRVKNPATGEQETKEMIYVRSVREANRLKNPPPTQGNLSM